MDTLLAALASGLTGCRVIFHAHGVRLPFVFPVDPGYPTVGDTDPANGGRGPKVLSWRATVPQGTDMVPATEVELQTSDGRRVERVKLPVPFTPSATHSTVVWVNLTLAKTL